MNTYTYTEDQLFQELNKIKTKILNILLNKEMVNKKDYDYFMNHFEIVLRSKERRYGKQEI